MLMNTQRLDGGDGQRDGKGTRTEMESLPAILNKKKDTFRYGYIEQVTSGPPARSRADQIEPNNSVYLV